MKKRNEAELTRELLKRINDVYSSNSKKGCVIVDNVIYTAEEYEKILMSNL